MASQARTRSCRRLSSGDTTKTWWMVSSGGGVWAAKVPTIEPPFAATVSTVRPVPKSRGNSSKVVVSGSSASLPRKWTSLPTKKHNSPPEKQRIRALYEGGNAAKTSTVSAERVLSPPQQSAVPWAPTRRQPPHFDGLGNPRGKRSSSTDGEAPTASASKDSAGNACTSSAWRHNISSSSASSTPSAQSSKAPPRADQLPSSCGFSKPCCAQNWTNSWKL
mmetsp:Transcript_77802/g.197671  ORF Transcript_77802/g.197671 Transcript_77802/m.197671 type:complete len:220 (-) Transcript_77802:152-811(-)